MSYYLICLLLPILFLFVYSIEWNRCGSYSVAVLFFFILVSNFGYWQLSIATTLPHAILANKILYVGGCFIPMTMLLTVLSYCKVRVKTPVRLALYFFTTFVLLCAFSVGHSDLYYKNITLDLVDGTYQLVKEYGPLHALFYPMLISYALCGVGVMLHAIKKRKNISFSSVLLLLFANLITLVAFFLGRSFGVELVPVCYVLAQLALLIFSDRLARYNVDATVVSTLLNRGSMGVASFDKANHFLGCNDVACKFFPPFASLRIDWSPPQTGDGMQQLSVWLTAAKKQETSEFDYVRNGRFYKVVVQPQETKRVKRGCHLILTDCTEEKLREQYLQHIAVTDQLTGLFNRRAYLDAIAQIADGALPENMIVVAADLNGLKHVNDTRGHAEGDRMIIAAADCLRASLCRYGKVYRTGGDEFAGIMYCDAAQMQEALVVLQSDAERWQEKTGETLTISIGTAAVAKFPDYDLHELQKEADKRMYAAKNDYYRRTGLDRRKG